MAWEEVGLETKLEPVLERTRILVALSPPFRALDDPLLRRVFAR